MRLSALHLNSMNNVSVKNEYLKNCLVYDKVKYNGKFGILKKILISVKDRNEILFTVVEQGAGKNESKVFILMKPNKRAEAWDWLSNNIRKMLCSTNNQEIETSFPESEDKNNKYRKEMDQYLATAINIDQLLTHKNFGQKYASYVDATKARLESKEKTSIRNKIK